MQLHIQAADELPIYRQIVRQIVSAIAGGRMSAGEKLASHRDLAAQLVIAPLTVKKAYDELEREGFIRTERGRGTFVCDGSSSAAVGRARDRLRDGARSLLEQARQSGVLYDELLDLLLEVRKETDR
ncbi:MAG: GntR family transcriptional regulator [Planctomycetota bacterium]|jgi:GntR family transcriptional regulator